MPAIVIIPSRFNSTRFPGKPLSPLFNKTLIQYVYERAAKSTLAEKVFVATDDRRIYDAAEKFGGKAIMTSPAHESGTDRIAESVSKLEASGYRIAESDIIVNVQGDEPMIEPEMVDGVISLMDDQRASIGTLVKKIDNMTDLTDPNVVKAVFDNEGFAMYFSRSPIPYYRDGKMLNEDDSLTQNFFYKHVGIYAYRKKVLMEFSKMPPSRLETAEKLEQLRALENGYRIIVKETFFETIGVDTPMDLERVKKCLSLSL